MNDERDSKNLLEGFAQVTLEDWKTIVEKGLRSENRRFEDLTSITPDGIPLSPLYTEADEAGLPHLGSAPGRSPFVRGSSPASPTATTGAIRADVDLPTPEGAARVIREDLASGATAIGLELDGAVRLGFDPDDARGSDSAGREGTSCAFVSEMALALGAVNLGATPVLLGAGAGGPGVFALLAAAAERKATPPARLVGSIGLDPLGRLAAEGALPAPLEELYDEMAALALHLRGIGNRNLGVALVGADLFHNAGGTAVHELAFALASGVEILVALVDRGLAPSEAATRIAFRFSVGTKFLLEISKLRAARLLWDLALRTLGCDETSRAMALHTRTSAFTASALDPHTNLLRATVGTHAAIVGGATSHAVAPYDEPRGRPDSSSRRTSRNVQILLREEAGLDRVADPAGGSYLVEHLTDALGRRAWSLFQEVERQGGLATALAQGFPQAELERAAEARTEAIAKSEEVYIGATKFRPPPNGSGPWKIDPDATLEEKRRELGARCARARRARDPSVQEAVLRALARMPERPGTDPAAVEVATAAARAGASLGEITAAWRARSRGPVSGIPRVRRWRGPEVAPREEAKP